jgi:type II secretory pathway pseudopilin PulG
VPVRAAVRSCRRPPECAHIGRAEGGFTAIELTVASSILLIVLVAIFSLLISLTKAEVRSQALADNQDQIRLALVAVGRDIRAATPLVPGVPPLVAEATSATYPYEIDFTQRNDPATYRWILNTATGVLSKQKLSGGSWVSSGQTFSGIANVAQNTPLFEYFDDASGVLLDPATTSATDIAKCANHVRVTIAGVAESGPAPFFGSSDVAVRDQSIGGIAGC